MKISGIVLLCTLILAYGMVARNGFKDYSEIEEQLSSKMKQLNSVLHNYYEFRNKVDENPGNWSTKQHKQNSIFNDKIGKLQQDFNNLIAQLNSISLLPGAKALGQNLRW